MKQKKLNDNNIRLDIIGDLSVFTPEIQNLAEKAQQQLQNNTGLNLVIATNYGGQWDIVEATKKIATKAVPMEKSALKVLTINCIWRSYSLSTIP